MKEEALTVHFIITGGTIDSHYDPNKKDNVVNENSIVPSYIEILKLYHGAEFTIVCMKDSRDLNREDLEKVLQTIEESPHEKILITHGTYTMPDTARFLKAQLKRTGQTIVLTASAIPIQGFSPSDGPFNLGYAIAKLEDLEPGVYVAMNGTVFSPEEVMKDLKEARFTSIFQK